MIMRDSVKVSTIVSLTVNLGSTPNLALITFYFHSYI